MTHAAPPEFEDFAALRRVPASVESWWVAQAREATGKSTDADALKAIAPEVQRLSDAFTCARPVCFESYAAKPEHRAAYGLFFFPQSWVRARLPLAEAQAVRGWDPPRDRTLRVLDVGAGSGPAGLSVATWLLAARPEERVELVAIDHAPEALTALRRLAAQALPARRLHTTTAAGDVRTMEAWPKETAGPFDLVLAAFVLNEAFAPVDDEDAVAWLAALASRLTPEGLLLVLEPGTKEAAGRLGSVAARAVGGGLFAWGPQLNAGAWELPKNRRTWMHEVRSWEPPASLAQVNRTLWRRIHELTYSYALLSRTAPTEVPATPRLHRLCSPVLRARGRLTWLGLGADGRLAEFEVQERDLAKGERARFLAFERGDVLDAADLLPLGRPDAWRLPSGSAVARHLTPESGSPQPT